MNKWFFLFLLLPLKLLGATPSETVIILEDISPKGAVVAKDVVIVGEGVLIVNNEKLSPSEVITQSEFVTKIANFKTSEITYQCSAGIFRHILKKGKLVKSEQGCLNSERYKSLKQSFSSLKKDRVTE